MPQNLKNMEQIIKATEIEVRNRDQYSSKERNKVTRIYCFPAGETILDNFMEGRHTRPHLVLKRDVIPKALEALKLPANTKVRWSIYAGCSCPCSPGFIVNASRGVDVYITYKDIAEAKKK